MISFKGEASNFPDSSVVKTLHFHCIPGELPDSGIQPGSPALQADALTSEPPRREGSGILREEERTNFFSLYIL